MKRPKRIEQVAKGDRGAAIYARYALRLERVIRHLGHSPDRYYPLGCWCDVYIGNPMLRGQHMASCHLAQEVMKEIQG